MKFFEKRKKTLKKKKASLPHPFFFLQNSPENLAIFFCMALGKINFKKTCDFADNLNINEVKPALINRKILEPSFLLCQNKKISSNPLLQLL
jgi:uncharacterized protein with ParB-like and HNH nuclease domain